jgi:hypothetical protein
MRNVRVLNTECYTYDTKMRMEVMLSGANPRAGVKKHQFKIISFLFILQELILQLF